MKVHKKLRSVYVFLVAQHFLFVTPACPDTPSIVQLAVLLTGLRLSINTKSLACKILNGGIPLTVSPTFHLTA
jgi:hypothetical protein